MKNLSRFFARAALVLGTAILTTGAVAADADKDQKPDNADSAPPAKGERNPAAPQWVLPEVRAPRVQSRTFDSAAVKTKVIYFIYTPEQYDTEKQRRFPVLYSLHGAGGGPAGVRTLVARAWASSQG